MARYGRLANLSALSSHKVAERTFFSCDRRCSSSVAPSSAALAITSSMYCAQEIRCLPETSSMYERNRQPAASRTVEMPAALQKINQLVKGDSERDTMSIK